MKEQMLKLQQIRDTARAQEHEKPWFIITARLLSLSVEQIQQSGWDKTLWRAEWGQLERIQHGKAEVVAWHRPDGAEPVADVSDLPENIRILRFALLGELIQTIKATGNISFAKVGYPSNWQRCKVYLNGVEMSHVLEADVILGHVIITKRERGKIVYDKETENIKSQKVHGMVQIMVKEDVQTLF